jgi:hypothetical protein
LNALTAGRVVVSDAITTGVGRSAVGVVASSEITAASIASGAATVALLAGVGVASYEITKAIRCQVVEGNWMCDPGQPSGGAAVVYLPSGNGAVSSVPPLGTFATIPLACEAYRQAVVQSFIDIGEPNPVVTVTACNASGMTAQIAGYGTRFGSMSTQPGTGSCPASVDALNPAWSVPAGSPPGADGKCATGRYDGVAATQVAALIQPQLTAQNAPAVATEVLEKGGTLQNGPVTVTGPATKPVGTITSTTPTGSTTTSVVNNYTYQGDTYSWIETSTSTVNNAGSDPVTTTTTTDAPADDRTPCEIDPGTVGCMKPGELPTEKPTWETKTVDYTVDDLGLPSGCPAPRVMAWRGIDLVLNYQPVCDNASTVRLALIAVTALSCIGIILGVTRT